MIIIAFITGFIIGFLLGKIKIVDGELRFSSRPRNKAYWSRHEMEESQWQNDSTTETEKNK